MPFFGQKQHFWSLKLQILMPIWPFKCFVDCFTNNPPLLPLHDDRHFGAPLSIFTGEIKWKNAFRRPKGLQNLNFQCPKMLFLTKKGQFLSPKLIKTQYDCFLIVFCPLKPKSITYMHIIMILANLAHFRPTLANWFQ